MAQKNRILFVCLGNICRSPAAEGIFLKKIHAAGLGDKFHIDSAATSSYNIGDPPDARMIHHAKKRGYDLVGKARKFYPDLDFSGFDLIVVMDRSNLSDVLKQAKNDQEKSKVQLMCEFCSGHDLLEVPDPYWGGEEGFEHVLDILEDACEGLINSYHQK